MSKLIDKKYARYALIHIILFIISCIAGYFVGAVTDGIGNIPFINKPFYEYFIHNAKSCFLLIGVGFITFGYLTWVPLMFNGAIMGIAINYLTYSYSALQIINLFAHAAFEIPALFLAIYLGRVLYIEVKFTVVDNIKNRTLSISSNASNYIKIVTLMFIMVCFLLVASFIEAIPK